MIKNIMNNIGVKPVIVDDKDKALERYKTDAKNMAREQLEYYVDDLKNGTGNLGEEFLEERLKIYGDELEARNRKRDTDPMTYIPKKNDELRVMFQKEKDPEIKAAMKEALKKHASMMPSEPFATEEE